jgi:hypothetical protein
VEAFQAEDVLPRCVSLLQKPVHVPNLWFYAEADLYGQGQQLPRCAKLWAHNRPCGLPFEWALGGDSRRRALV